MISHMEKKALAIFYSMPSIPNCPDSILEPGALHSLGPNDHIFVCQTYDNKQDLIFALSMKSTREGFSLRQNIHTKIFTRFIVK